MFRRTLLAFFALLLPVEAQLRVELTIPRRLYLAYEPVVATVTISNLAGRDITLRDHGGQQWFGFQIRTGEDRIIASRSPDYRLDPLTIPAGQQVKRRVNLVELYPVTEYGLYRVRATIYVAEMDRYFSSQPRNIEVSEGRILWQEQVGVPEGYEGAGGHRVLTVLSFRQPKENILYARVQNEEEGVIYCTYPLGRLLAGNDPEIMVDRENQLHIMQVIGPKTWLYSRVGLNGEWFGQKTFVSTKTRPRLARNEIGVVAVKGGREDVPFDPAMVADGPPPKISERPPGMPR